MRAFLLLAGAGLILGAALVAGIAGCGSGAADEVEVPAAAVESGRAHHFDVRRIATGLSRPTFVGAAPGDLDGLWVLEQPGRVLRLEAGRPSTPLDLSHVVRTGTEQGLLGLAFDPDFKRSGRLFLHWTNKAGNTRVAEFRLRGDGTIAPRPVRFLLSLKQPELRKQQLVGLLLSGAGVDAQLRLVASRSGPRLRGAVGLVKRPQDVF